MIQIPLQLHNLPIQAILISNGQIGLVKLGIFPTLFDWDNQTIISQEDIVVKGTKYLYNHGYNLEGHLKEWLISLELGSPFEEYYENV